MPAFSARSTLSRSRPKSAIGAKLNGVKASRTMALSVVAPCAMIRSRTFTLALSPPAVPTRISFCTP